MKILITGAIGYIGTELCKSYFGTDHEILAIDKRFVSDRVKILRDNNISFVHGDVLDEDLMTSILENVDLVYHLAGTTDVAYSKFNDNDEKDVDIRKNGVDATLVVLKKMPKGCKIVFPSTHVVYEGLEETTLNIEEDFPTKPYLTYAQTKNQNEIDIKENSDNYIILRLGSVYGYSSDTMRMNIMPNLFSKITSQDGQITLFSGGDNHKSLVSVLDVVDAMRFFGEGSFTNETYHLTDENLTVKEVSRICKNVNPKVSIVETMSEISLGYSPDYNLSNKKILSTGFSFKRNITDSIKEMVYNWSGQDNRNYIMGFKDDCRVSGSVDKRTVVSLGLSPLANNLLQDRNEEVELYPLVLDYYPGSNNVQLNYVVDPKKMFTDYLYVSSTTKSFREHFRTATESYIEQFDMSVNSFVIDIGSNDGIALVPFVERNIKVLGVEPAQNIQKIAEDKGIPTINEFFTKDTAKGIVEKYGMANLVLASNVFAHSDKIDDMTSGVKTLLSEDGVFVVEVQYLIDTINDLTFDNVYHEHVNYWSVHSILEFFAKRNMSVFKVEHVPTHGGSIRVYVDNGVRDKHNSVNEYISKEIEFGINDLKTYLDFGKRIERTKLNVIENLKKFRQDGLSVVGYGAPAKATTMMNYYGITNDLIEFVVEDNDLKHFKFIPGTGIQIMPKETILSKKPDVLIVFAWNFIEEIKRNNSDLLNSGVVFHSIRDLQNNLF